MEPVLFRAECQAPWMDMICLAWRIDRPDATTFFHGATASGYDHACMAWALRAYRIPIGLEASQRSAVDKIPVASWMCMRARGLSPMPEPIHMACLMWYRPDGKGCCTTAGNRRGTAGRLFSGAFSCVADLLAMSALSRIQDFIIEYANQNLHIHLIQTI